jgi:hypothetical protein
MKEYCDTVSASGSLVLSIQGIYNKKTVKMYVKTY